MAFADAFKKYKTGQRNAEALSVPYPAESGHKKALVYDKFALSSECGVQPALVPLAIGPHPVSVQAAGCHLLKAACHMARVWLVDVHMQHSWQSGSGAFSTLLCLLQRAFHRRCCASACL